jgi:hypothetical protein
MKLILKIYDALPCETKEFTINGIEAEQDWFVDNYDNGDGEEIEYGCNNRVTDLLSLEQVRKNLPKELKTLTDDEIIKIQEKLEEELISGGCGWCV